MSRSISYETGADGFGDLATDEDRDSFCEFVERRLAETYPDYECSASWSNRSLDSRVSVDSDDRDAPDAQELRSWVGNELWNEWCAGPHEATAAQV